jgi:predicted nucleotidyltransferase component of viral defense system
LKKLSLDLIEKITDFEAESALSLRGYALEKDYFVTEVLALIRSMPPNPDFRWVFCGGTSLAKAFGIVQRMSEDLDFKLMPSHAPSVRSKSQLRRQLSACADQVMAALEQAGYGPHAVTRRSMDSNAYTVLEIEYESAYAKPSTLRSRLLLKINHTTRICVTEKRPVGLLLDLLISGHYKDPIEIECASLRDTLVEKCVAFPRRLAQHLANTSPTQTLSKDSGWDTALVRHIYDVHQMLQSDPAMAQADKALIQTVEDVIAQDAQEFAAQFPGFASNPWAHIQNALSWAEASPVLAAQYQAFVADMVYAPPEQIPTYRQALDVFSQALLASRP